MESLKPIRRIAIVGTGLTGAKHQACHVLGDTGERPELSQTIRGDSRNEITLHGPIHPWRTGSNFTDTAFKGLVGRGQMWTSLSKPQ